MSEESLVLCYNKGCGQRFDPLKNNENSCTHHPGAPVFHDAYKSWSCCSKKTTDFTEFLNIKGCATSCHNNVKPKEVVKEKADISLEIKEETKNVPEKPRPLERPSDTEPLDRLNATITNSLKTELLKLSAKSESENASHEESPVIPHGTSCKNGGCTKSYESDADNSETCMHHPGVPVFHEGMKFWTCCMRRTTDFENFLEQLGCTAGKHLWVKPKSDNDIKQSCRYDWYQAGPFVYITVYAKTPIPDESYVEVNKVRLHAYIVFGADHTRFEMDILLFGIVDSNNSSVQFAGTKVEIKLKKAEAVQWSKLVLPADNSKTPVEHLEDNLDDTLRL